MNLGGPDRNLLVALDALLSERSVTRAAQRVGLSQPGMSNALGRLRRLLDDPLLVRQGATLVPTARAETLIGPVHEALELIRSALDAQRSFDPVHRNGVAAGRQATSRTSAWPRRCRVSSPMTMFDACCWAGVRSLRGVRFQATFRRRAGRGAEVAQRLLIRGAFVISMDRDVGDLLPGDILVEEDKIAAIGGALDVEDAEVVDATHTIAIPGFVDTHRHTWETVIRGVAPDVTLAEYFATILDAFAPAYRPQDVGVSNYLGALEAVNSGITTLLDWSHINNTPDHADAGIDGLRRAGLRAVYCHGTPNTSLAEWWGVSTREHPEDVRRIRDQYFATDDGLITLAMATRGPGFCTDEVVRHDWELARDIGAPISVHVNMGPQAGRFSMVQQLDRLGLLGDDTTYIHCTTSATRRSG